MTRLTPLFAVGLFLLPTSFVAAHCQVPCGIYGDQRRFEEMLEDTETIAKSINETHAIVEKMGADDLTILDINQLPRWIATKESHASNIQKIIADYFLAQRIKADNPRYVEQLKAAHGVIVAAMKSKQSADPATATALKKAILDLYRAYEGKEPTFSHTHPPATKKVAHVGR